MLEIIDLKKLLKPICSRNPAGINLRLEVAHDSLYYKAKELRTVARDIERKMQYGQNCVSVDPYWDEILKICINILENHSKDLEVVAWLIEALLRRYEFEGLNCGLILLYKLIDECWAQLFPLPDDDGIEIRVAALIGLFGKDFEGTLINPIYNVMITQGNVVGPFNLWQYKQAIKNSKISDSKSRKIKAERGEIFSEDFEKSIKESTSKFYKELSLKLFETTKELQQLNSLLNKKCGGYILSFVQIESALEDFKNHMGFILNDFPFLIESKKNGHGKTDNVKSNVLDIDKSADRKGLTENQFKKREEALIMLAKIADFFKDTEPHSPIPYLLNRAISFSKLSFPELLKEIIDDENTRENTYRLIGICLDEESASNKFI